MDKAQSDFDFKIMSLIYRFRDLFSPPRNILGEAGIEQGFHVLDYGCGPGSYTTPLEALVGKSGKIYALDIHPLAIKKVQRIVSKKHLINVETIHSDCKTGLPDNSVNVVLLYDILHDLSDPNGVLEELHRVLKPGGILSFTDHHLNEDETLSKVTNKGLFRLSKKGKKTYTFSKEG